VHVLLLHGLPADAHDWAQVVERLGPLGAAPIAPDRPGWGSSSGRGRDLSGNVAAAIAALESAGARTAVVVGHSWGTLVALALGEEHRERVAALCLVAPFGPGSQATATKIFASPRAARPLIAANLGISAHAQRMPLVGPLIGRRFHLSASARTHRGRHWRTERAREAFLLDRRSVAADLPRLLERATAVSAPTVVLVGERDRTTGVEPARRLARLIPDARFHLVPRAGHFLPLTHPDAVAEAIGRLLEETLST
jgi:pimeloyl-ACP methyl ester carboxylesterase